MAFDKVHTSTKRT